MSGNGVMFAVVGKCGAIMAIKRTLGDETADFLAVFMSEDEALRVAFFVETHFPEHKPRVQPIANNFVSVDRS